ncbi:MAG: hypothetical protein CMJ83_04610 [Planctomycetes bacterium]|nr:hypothetical protein [Planctomycetota bacterium]
MADTSGAPRTIDLTRSSGGSWTGITIWFIVLLVAAGTLYAIFFHDSGRPARPGLEPRDGQTRHDFDLAGHRLSLLLDPEWTSTVEGSELRLELRSDLSAETLSLSILPLPTKLDPILQSLAQEFIDTDGGTLEIDRQRWLDEEDGLPAHEVVIARERSAPDLEPARDHRVWVRHGGRVLAIRFVVPEGAAAQLEDRAESVLASLR